MPCLVGDVDALDGLELPHLELCRFTEAGELNVDDAVTAARPVVAAEVSHFSVRPSICEWLPFGTA